MSFPLRHLALGLIIRELLAPWTGHPYDFEIWTRLGFYVQNLTNPYRALPYVPGLSFSPYATTGSISYPPFSAFIFALTYRLYVLLGGPSRFLYYFLLKQPMVLADIGAAVVLAKIILLSGDARSARNVFLVWLYFPLGIIISSIWGQLDPFSLLLSLLAIYYFLHSKWMFSALMLGLSIYLKTLPIVFLPVLVLSIRSGAKKLGYSLASLAIPILGTLLPALAFKWGYQGMYNNFSFQLVIPSTGVGYLVGQGGMSLLGQVSNVLPSLSLVDSFTGFIWMPVMLAVYLYTWKKSLPMVQGLLIAILAFSISRPFLPEQWSLYPLALLLVANIPGKMRHFIGLAVSTTGFLLANNILLVKFFSPISVEAFNWDIALLSQSPMSPFGVVRSTIMLATLLLYLVESIFIVKGKESLVYRAIVLATPPRFWQKSRISPTEFHPV